MNSFDKFDNEASNDWKLNKNQLKNTKLKDFEIEYLEDFFMDLEELLVKDIANYDMVKTYPIYHEESDLIFRVFRFNRGIRDYRVAISQTKSASIVMFINPDTPNDLVNQVNKLTDKLVKAYNHKYKIKSTNLFKPSKFHALVNRPSKLN